MPKFISIDLDSQGIFAVGGTASRGQARVEQAIAWSGPETEGGPPILTAETATRIGEQLRDRLRAAGVANAPVVVTIGRDRVVLKELRYPAVPPPEEPNIVRFQALKELSDSPDDIVLDYVPLSNGAPTGERRSMAVAVRKDLFNAIQTMCTAANLKLAAVTPRPYALAASLSQAFATGAVTPPESKADAVAVFAVGPGGGEFTVTRNGEVTFTLAVPAPVVASEPMLLVQVRRNLTTYAGSNPEHPIQALYVAEADGRWSEKLRSALGIPVHAYDPLGGAVPAVPEPARGRFAAAAGMLAAGAGEIPINFVTPRQPKADADPNKNRILIAALAAMLILGIGGAVGYFLLDSASDNIARLTQEREDKQKRFTDMEPNAKRLDAAKQWLGRRVVWLDELYDMTDRFPHTSNFYASSFAGKANPLETKTGKQAGTNATLNLKVAARSLEPVDTLLSSFDRENTNPKSKVYVDPTKNPGAITQYDKEARESTITVKVNSRLTDAFTWTNPKGFVPPQRKNYPPPAASAKEKDPKTPKEPDGSEEGSDNVAPPPKEKPGGGE